MCCLDDYTIGLPRGGTVKMCIGPTNDVKEPVACNKPLTSPACPPVCFIYCEFGNVMDDDGCPTCSCKEPTAWTVHGSLVLNVADASRVASSRSLHHVFAW